MARKMDDLPPALLAEISGRLGRDSDLHAWRSTSKYLLEGSVPESEPFLDALAAICQPSNTFHFFHVRIHSADPADTYVLKHTFGPVFTLVHPGGSETEVANLQSLLSRLSPASSRFRRIVIFERDRPQLEGPVWDGPSFRLRAEDYLRGPPCASFEERLSRLMDFLEGRPLNEWAGRWVLQVSTTKDMRFSDILRPSRTAAGRWMTRRTSHGCILTGWEDESRDRIFWLQRYYAKQRQEEPKHIMTGLGALTYSAPSWEPELTL